MHHRPSRRSFASLASLLAALPPQRSRATGLEEVRKAASLLPGYGPPDIAFPPPFRGRWRVTRQVVDVQTPLGETAAPREALRQARDSLVAPPVTFEQRFVQDSERAVIADRSFNAERRTAAISGTALADLEARWEPSNPNVLTLARVSTSSLVETKVTKRSFEAPLAHRRQTPSPSQPQSCEQAPFDGAFGTSEYARIADAGSSGVLSSVPPTRTSVLSPSRTVSGLWQPRVVGADDPRCARAGTWADHPEMVRDGRRSPEMARVRCQAKYKWEPAGEPGAVARIEGLEITSTFDPTQTGFADLSGATPVLVTKARLRFERE